MIRNIIIFLLFVLPCLAKGAAVWPDRIAAGDKSDNRIPQGGTPGWDILNFNVGYEPGVFNISLSLQNLLNTDYRYHGSGINGQGRTVLISLMINLGIL